MNAKEDWDLTDLRRMWKERREALAVILERFDTRGMTRPARDPDERQWLGERAAGPFVEDEAAAAAARAYYTRRYTRR